MSGNSSAALRHDGTSDRTAQAKSAEEFIAELRQHRKAEPADNTDPYYHLRYPRQVHEQLAYGPISLHEQSPMLIHLALPPGWKAHIDRDTSKITFQDLFARYGEPHHLDLPPVILVNTTVTPPGWTRICSEGRLSWHSQATDRRGYIRHVRYTFPSTLDETPRCRLLDPARNFVTDNGTRHILHDTGGCFRIRTGGSFFTNCTIDHPCQVLTWTWELERANPQLLQRLGEWSSFDQLGVV